MCGVYLVFIYDHVCMFVVDKTTGPVIHPKVALGKSRKMHYTCHVDSQHCTNYSNPLSSVTDVAIKVAIYQNQNQLNLNHLDKGLSLHSIQVSVGDTLKLECLSTNQHCEGQWMRDDVNVTEIISSRFVEWNKITEDAEGMYTCRTNQLCTSQKISVVIDVIKNGELLSF